jgi:hypothetical protein
MDVWTPDHSREQEEVDARVKANADIATLNRLVRSGLVLRTGEKLVRPSARRPQNPTIRPNAKKQRKKRR